MSSNQTLPSFVGYGEVSKQLGLSRRTIERMVREGTFPSPTQLSKNRVGWPLQTVQQWLDDKNRGMASISVKNPDDLEPEKLEDKARDLAVAALGKRVGRVIDPHKLSLHLTEHISADQFVALEMEEHRLRQEGLERLPALDAAVVAGYLMPSLRPVLISAMPDLAKLLRSNREVKLQFDLISDVLKLFELSARLSEAGARAPAGQTILGHFATFATRRALFVAAKLFPSLRQMIVADADDSQDASVFASDDLFEAAVAAALDDSAWAEFEAKWRQ